MLPFLSILKNVLQKETLNVKWMWPDRIYICTWEKNVKLEINEIETEFKIKSDFLWKFKLYMYQ